MQHTMSLGLTQFYNMVKSGTKTVELRLWDEKRRQISIGDEIMFTNADDKTTVIVTGLYISDTFENLFKMFDVRDAGIGDVKTAIDTIATIYPIERQRANGVVGIKIKLKQN